MAGVALITQRLLRLIPVLLAMALFAAGFDVDVIGAMCNFIVRGRCGGGEMRSIVLFECWDLSMRF